MTCADSENGALDDGCNDALPVCLTVGHGASCVLCEASDNASGDFGCGGKTPFCDEDARPRTCVECRTTDDCKGDETCSKGRCRGGDTDGDGVDMIPSDGGTAPGTVDEVDAGADAGPVVDAGLAFDAGPAVDVGGSGCDCRASGARSTRKSALCVVAAGGHGGRVAEAPFAFALSI
jgi:hypothetical protein